MAVAQANLAYVVPIFRQEGIPFSSPIVGRWHGKATVLGDGSGGNATAQVTIGGTTGVFPFTALFDIRFISYYATATPAWGQLYLGLTERTNSNNAFDSGLDAQYALFVDTSQYWNLANPTTPFKDMLFRLSMQGTGDNYIYYKTSNVNGVYSTLVCGGIIYDERLV